MPTPEETAEREQRRADRRAEALREVETQNALWRQRQNQRYGPVQNIVPRPPNSAAIDHTYIQNPGEAIAELERRRRARIDMEMIEEQLRAPPPSSATEAAIRDFQRRLETNQFIIPDNHSAVPLSSRDGVTWMGTPLQANDVFQQHVGQQFTIGANTQWVLRNSSPTIPPLSIPVETQSTERAFMPLLPLPQPHTWLKPLPPETRAELTHPDNPAWEAPIDREVDPDKHAPHKAQTGNLLHLNGAAFQAGVLFRDSKGQLRRVVESDRHLLRASPRGEPHLASVPFFGFATESTSNSRSEAQYPANVNGDDPTRPIYTVSPAKTKKIEITFTQEEINTAPHTFGTQLTNAIAEGQIASITFVSTKTMEDGTTQTKSFTCNEVTSSFYHRLGATNAQYTAFKLARPYRIGNTLYNYLLFRNMEFRFAQWTGEPGNMQCNTVSRQMWPVGDITIVGMFMFVAPSPPQTYLQGYEGVPFVCQNCNAAHIADTMFRNVNLQTGGSAVNYRICMACPVSSCTTVGCNAVFDPRDQLRRMAGENPQRLHIVRNVCGRCINRNYSSCQCCNNLVLRGELGSNGYCVECRRNTVMCGDCGSRFRPVSEGQTECRTCSTRTIREYSYKPNPKYRQLSSGGETTNSQNRYYGIELEVENPSASVDELGEFAGTIARKMSDGLIYVKRDGSLNNGFEIVTHPFTEKWYNAEGKDMWDKLLHYLRRNGFVAETTETCGMHVHVTRRSIDTEALYNAQRFVGGNTLLIQALSRRSARSLEEWASPRANQDMTEARHLARGEIGVKRNRRAALNFTEHTVEVRFPRSNLTTNGFNANLEMVESLFDYAGSGLGDSDVVKGANYLSYVRGNGSRFNDLAYHLFPTVGVDGVVQGRASAPGTIPQRDPMTLDVASDVDDEDEPEDEDFEVDQAERDVRNRARPDGAETRDYPIRESETVMEWRSRLRLPSDVWPSLSAIRNANQ